MTSIYHITHISNLQNILNEGGLRCDRAVTDYGLAHRSIAHQHIKDRRAIKRIPCTPDSTLADHVPFYFAPRSPMLYAIFRGSVEGYNEGQRPILHLVSSVEILCANGLQFVFTDGHADVDISRFYTDLCDLERVDWDIMKSKYWHDTLQDGDRKRRRQAEFLVRDFFPWSLILEIGVINHTIAQQVRGLLQGATYQPNVNIYPSWYF